MDFVKAYNCRKIVSVLKVFFGVSYFNANTN